jgi:hypothetical protein
MVIIHYFEFNRILNYCYIMYSDFENKCLAAWERIEGKLDNLEQVVQELRTQPRTIDSLGSSDSTDFVESDQVNSID